MIADEATLISWFLIKVAILKTFKNLSHYFLYQIYVNKFWDKKEYFFGTPPLYSFDLVTIKCSQLRSYHLKTLENIKQAERNRMKAVSVKDFQHCFQK